MRALVLAAGAGTRLRPHTRDRPKCLVELAGASLLEHQLRVFARQGVRDVHIATGYRAEQLEALRHPTHHNPDFATSNMVKSLMCASELLDGSGDLVISYGDLVFEERVLAALVACPAPLATAVDRSWQRLWRLRMPDPLADAETLRLDASGDIRELGRKPGSLDEIEGQYMGLTLVRAAVAPELVRAWERIDPAAPFDGRRKDDMYMTSFLQHLIDGGRPLRAALVDGGWLEVDSAGDLALYRRLHAEGKLDSLCRLVEPG